MLTSTHVRNHTTCARGSNSTNNALKWVPLVGDMKGKYTRSICTMFGPLKAKTEREGLYQSHMIIESDSKPKDDKTSRLKVVEAWLYEKPYAIWL